MVAFVSLFSFGNLFCQEVIMKREFIYDKAPFPSCHASTIVETRGGLVAAWFGGTNEKNPDVEIWVSRNVNGSWDAPVSVANGVQAAGNRYPCWNPVLFQYPGGPLMLFYKVGADPIKWWGELKTSTDNGKTWSKAERLPDSILGPIKNKPVLLANGVLMSPTSVEYENGRWAVHVETSSDKGRSWQRSKPVCEGSGFDIIQPSILRHPGGRLQMLCRSKQNRIVSAWSNDNGVSWTDCAALDLPNPNSGTDAVALKNGLQLLVYNPTQAPAGKWGGPRTPLSVAVSKHGRNWKEIAVLENEPGEYSYPAVIQAADGKVHITYTWKREKIRHVVLDGAKIKL
jgi:predicted neuraminidase